MAWWLWAIGIVVVGWLGLRFIAAPAAENFFIDRLQKASPSDKNKIKQNIMNDKSISQNEKNQALDLLNKWTSGKSALMTSARYTNSMFSSQRLSV